MTHQESERVPNDTIDRDNNVPSLHSDQDQIYDQESETLINYNTKFKTNSNRSLTLLDLPWDTVSSYHILPYLNIKELFFLRAVSKSCLELVQTHFSLSFSINTSIYKDSFHQDAFRIVSQDTHCLKAMMLRNAKSWLNNELLLPVIADNPRLEKLDLTGCISLTGASVYSIGVRCKQLKHLSLRDCVWLVRDNFLPFVSNPRNLEYLDMTGCWNIDDDLVVNMAAAHPCLKHLLLGNLYGLTDRAVVSVAHCCPALVQLNLKGCWRVTDQSIHLLCQFCPKLKFLHVKECQKVTESSLAPLRARGVRVDRLGPPRSGLARLDPSQRPNMQI